LPVSILVLMDLCIKTEETFSFIFCLLVSILVLMDLCIKTSSITVIKISPEGFNPCFNGSMYKNFRKEGEKNG